MHHSFHLLEQQRASGIEPQSYLLWGNDEAKKEKAIAWITAPYRSNKERVDPNIHEVGVREGENSISIKDIREARLRAYESPFSNVAGNAKTIIIIRGLEMVTGQGASVLLKILEEPPKHTIFIATTNHFYGTLPTLRSRFSSFRFYAPSSHEKSASFDRAKTVDDMRRIADRGGVEEFVGGRISAMEHLMRSHSGSKNLSYAIASCERMVEAYHALLTNPTMNRRLVGEYVALLS